VAWAGSTVKLTVPGNYAAASTGSCVGALPQTIATSDTALNSGETATKTAMGTQMYGHYYYGLGTANSNGIKVVAGTDHWDLYDEQAIGYSPGLGFGLFTDNDNPYDGVAAGTIGCVDQSGYSCGGELFNYGDLFGSCSSAGTLCYLFLNIYSYL
jgi:hypothetical protein